jgi:hypothetical protein
MQFEMLTLSFQLLKRQCADRSSVSVDNGNGLIYKLNLTAFLFIQTSVSIFVCSELARHFIV